MTKGKVRVTNLLPTMDVSLCDICADFKAEYDAKTFRGPWAFMCKSCFEKFGVGLGMGKGQILKGDVK